MKSIAELSQAFDKLVLGEQVILEESIELNKAVAFFAAQDILTQL